MTHTNRTGSHALHAGIALPCTQSWGAAALALATLLATAPAVKAQMHEPWSVTSAADKSELRVLPDSARGQADGAGDALVEHTSRDQERTRRRMQVTGCHQGHGLVTIENDDTGFGIRQWHSDGRYTFDLLAVRVCAAARAQKN